MTIDPVFSASVAFTQASSPTLDRAGDTWVARAGDPPQRDADLRRSGGEPRRRHLLHGVRRVATSRRSTRPWPRRIEG